MNPFDTPGVDPCEHCERPMRPFRASAKDYPGTLYRAGKTCCGSCKNGLRNGTGPVKAGKFKAGMSCLGCGQALRAFGSSLKANPGTVPHSEGGRCKKCAKEFQFLRDLEEARLTGKLPPVRPRDSRVRLVTIGERPENLSPVSLRHREDLERYIADRRARKIPPEGLPLEVWTERAKVE